MSNTGKKKFPCHDKSNDSRPKVVKKLNFDKSSGSNLKICYSRPTRPETNIFNETQYDRQLLVSEWLKKHKDDFFESENLVYPCSPILSSSFTKRTPDSPIAGNSSKRPRRIFSQQSDSSQVNNSNLLDVDCSKTKHDSFILSPTRQTHCQREELQVQEKSHEENDTFLSKSPSTSNVNRSPILTRKILARKLERKKLLREKNKTNEETLRTENSKKSGNRSVQNEPNISLIMTIPDQKCSSSQIEDDTFFEVNEFEKQALKSEDNDGKILANNLSATQRIDTCEESPVTDYKSRNKLEFEIETESESSLKENLLEEKNDKVIGENDSTFIDDGTNSVSDKPQSYLFIEDADTPDIFLNCVNKKPKISENVILCESPSKDSEDTYFSKAESVKSQAIQPSQKISQISSSKIIRENSSDVNHIISNETSSSKPIVESFSVFPKTEKKKRRVKRGSLIEKIKKLVSREISFLRIWQHQINQTSFQNVNSQFVELCIKNLYIAYNRQFAECCLISDKHNLLKNLFESKTEIKGESQDVNSERVIKRLLTIMTAPEIVGKLKAEKGNILKVFSPWEIVDQKNLILSVMYFTVDKKVNLEIIDEKPVEKVISKRIEKFDCPCIQVGEIVEDCSLRFTNKKPNVIQEIFNSL